MQKCLPYFVVVLAIAGNVQSAFSQHYSGSLMVLYRTDDKVVVAAESLLTVNLPDGSIAHRYGCKITALGSHIIFASTGYFGALPKSQKVIPQQITLRTVEEAKATYNRLENAPIEDIANSWANAVISYAATQDAEGVRKIAVENYGEVSQAIFVDARPMRPFTVLHVVLTYDLNKIFNPMSFVSAPVPTHGAGACLTPIGPYCGGGETKFFNELVNTRIPHDDPKLAALDKGRPKSRDVDTWRTRRLVELCIQNDKSGKIGGVVNVAMVRPGYPVEWAHTPNCESQKRK